LANMAIVWKAGITHAFTSTKRLAQVIPTWGRRRTPHNGGPGKDKSPESLMITGLAV
jgi:hypothetical protein